MDNQGLNDIETNAGEHVSYCPRCGATIAEGQDFCPKCGRKINGLSSKKRRWPKVLIAVVLIAAVIIAGVTILPGVLPSTTKYLKEADYDKAYKYARDDDSRNAVRFENAVAYSSEIVIGMLNDPTSFDLRDAYYYKGGNDKVEGLVLYVLAKNKMGGTVGGYSLFTKSDITSWGYVDTISSDGDSSNNIFNKELAASRSSDIHQVMQEGTKLSKDGVDRINNLFKEERLDGSIKLMSAGH